MTVGKCAASADVARMLISAGNHEAASSAVIRGRGRKVRGGELDVRGRLTHQLVGYDASRRLCDCFSHVDAVGDQKR